MDGFNFLFLFFCGLCFGLLLFNAAYDNLLWLLICFALFFGVTQFGFKYDVFSYARDNIGLIGLTAGVYLLLGIVWAFFKWRKLVKAKVKERNANFDSFIQAIAENKLPGLRDVELLKVADWKTYVRNSVLRDPVTASKSQDLEIKKIAEAFIKQFSVVTQPSIANYKDRFIGWFLFWPFSIIVFLLNDFMREFFEAVYYFFARKLQSISDSLWNE
jgi:hypothetical protein